MKQETSLIFSVLKGEAQRPLPAPSPRGNMGWVFSVAGPRLHVLGRASGPAVYECQA